MIWPAVRKKPFAGGSAHPDVDRAQRDRQLPGCSSERVGHDTVPGIRRVDLKSARAVAFDEQQAVPSLERVKHVGHAHTRRLGDASYDGVKLADDQGRSRDSGGYVGNVVLVTDDDQRFGKIGSQRYKNISKVRLEGRQYGYRVCATQDLEEVVSADRDRHDVRLENIHRLRHLKVEHVGALR